MRVLCECVLHLSGHLFQKAHWAAHDVCQAGIGKPMGPHNIIQLTQMVGVVSDG